MELMVVRKTALYCRYSSDMQRQDSCTDQERKIRQGLERKGIDATNAIVLFDEAESGTKTTRDGFAALQAMIASNEPILLAVDDQSRLTRADNASAFITD